MRGVAAGLIAFAAFALILAKPAPGAEAAFPGLTNGSFESGLAGWTVTGSVDHVCSFWQNASGDCSVDMAATPSQGQLSQVLATTVGNNYTVKFMMAGNPACSSNSAWWLTASWPLNEPSVKTLNVSATGTVAAAYSFDVAGKSDSNMG